MSLTPLVYRAAGVEQVERGGRGGGGGVLNKSVPQ